MPDVTAVPESKFVKLDGREFRESGMLFVINDLFMWPLGLAFGVTWDPATGVYNITINRLEPSETIEDDPTGWYCYSAVEFGSQSGSTSA